MIVKILYFLWFFITFLVFLEVILYGSLASAAEASWVWPTKYTSFFYLFGL